MTADDFESRPYNDRLAAAWRARTEPDPDPAPTYFDEHADQARTIIVSFRVKSVAHVVPASEVGWPDPNLAMERGMAAALAPFKFLRFDGRV